MRGVTCGISIATKGARCTRQVTHGHEVKWEESPGEVSFVPADDEDHTYWMTSDDGCELFLALIPQGHLKKVTAAEGVLASTEWSPLLASRDAIVSDCMARLAFASKANDSATQVGMDEVARRLVLRLTYLNGDGTPDWHGDASVFDARTLLGLVAHVDEHLQIAPSLSDMGSLVGLSPSHFARKFSLSTGLSLHRFINRRRILRSLEMLKTDSSLASVALDLGFSSQSHFTRLFGDLTGMSPAKYRKHFKRVVG